MTRWKLALLGGVAATLCVVLVLLFMRGERAPAAEEHTPTDPNVVELPLTAQRSAGLELVEVIERTIQTVVRTTGIVSADQKRIARIRPLARGIVDQVYVQLGDRVRKNQRLLRYDNIELGESVGEYLTARAELGRLEAQREVSRKFLARSESLLAVEGISQSEYELREAEYAQAVAAVESHRAKLAQVEEKLHRFGLEENDILALGRSERGTHRIASHSILRAPFSGVITRSNVSMGELVNRENELFVLVDASIVWVLADVYEKDIGLMESGGTCDVQVSSYPETTFTGKITYVSDFLDPTSRTAKVRCVLPNPDRRLKLEMFATVRIPSKRGRTALAVPVGALQQVNRETVAFVRLDETRFEKRALEVGQKTEEWVEVRGGLLKNEKVVTAGGFYLKSMLLREQIGEGH